MLIYFAAFSIKRDGTDAVTGSSLDDPVLIIHRHTFRMQLFEAYAVAGVSLADVFLLTHRSES